MLFYMFAWCAWLAYAVFTIIARVGLSKVKKTPLIKDDSKLPIASVVVAARDEETRIGRLLDCLEAQDYPRDKFEVIVVDDRSRDNTSKLVLERNSGVDFRVIRIRDEENLQNRSPKKYALSRGVKEAKGDIIVTTDADCWMGDKWLRAVLSPFTDPEVCGVTGVSMFTREEHQPKVWWSWIENLEHLSYTVMGSAFISVGHVFNAYGSNLAARKTHYMKAGGYAKSDEIISGDDVFLLQNIAEVGGKVLFLDRPEAWVFSNTVDTLYEWFNQRSRWTSKDFYYPPFLRMLVIAVSSFFLALVLSLPLALAGKISLLTPVILFCSRALMDHIPIRTGANHLKQPYSIWKYGIAVFILTYAIVLSGLRGQFFSFTWKEQDFHGARNERNQKPDE